MKTDIIKYMDENLVGMKEAKHFLHNVVLNAEYAKKTGELCKFPRLIVLIGNPGTGKTSFARYLAEIYKECGFLSTSEMVCPNINLTYFECCEQFRRDAEIAQKNGAMLFLDDYNVEKDLLNSILEFLDNSIVLCISLYPREAEKLFVINEGFRAHSCIITFDDYSVDEKMEIFKREMEKNNISADEDVLCVLRELFLIDSGNARTAIQYFYRMNSNRIERCIKNGILDEESKKFKVEDVYTLK